jgi:hypothetical protein
MKQIRFLALAFVLSVTSWASVQTRAEAHNFPQCALLEATPCSVQDSTTQCWVPPNPQDVRTCICMSDYVWHCPIYGSS